VAESAEGRDRNARYRRLLDETSCLLVRREQPLDLGEQGRIVSGLGG